MVDISLSQIVISLSSMGKPELGAKAHNFILGIVPLAHRHCGRKKNEGELN